jgi:hypothetical protein
MIEKPVAWLSKHDFAVTDEGEELCDSLNETENINLFTESQLKAERERAIREVAELFTFGAKARILKLLDN